MGRAAGGARQQAGRPAGRLAVRDHQYLELFSLTNRNWYIIDTRATHPDMWETNLYAALDWLVEVLLMPAAKRQEKAKQDNKKRRAQGV